MLFHGNSYLIEVFNTSLPPGHHIDAYTDPRYPNLITVTTPAPPSLGTMAPKISTGTQPAGAGGHLFMVLSLRLALPLLAYAPTHLSSDCNHHKLSRLLRRD